MRAKTKRRCSYDLRRIQETSARRRAIHAASCGTADYQVPAWCPFDTENSEFVIALKEAGHEVVFSHIFMGQDFFEYEPPKWDMIVSNPPFSRKQQVVERCLALGKPFALLLSNLWLNSSAPCRFFKEREMQILLFDKRINYSEKNTVNYGSSYF